MSPGGVHTVKIMRMVSPTASAARGCPGAADSLAAAQRYIRTDLPVAAVLKTPWSSLEYEVRMAYSMTLTQILYPGELEKLMVDSL